MRLPSRPILAVASVLGTAALAQGTPPPACPFKAAELQSALGVAFEEGKAGMDLKYPGATMRNCRYESRNYTVRVDSTVHEGGAAAAKKATQALAGKLVPVPGDPDGAVYQEGQGDMTSPAVHYARGNVSVQLRIMGVYYKDPASKNRDLVALREKLAGLRRIP